MSMVFVAPHIQHACFPPQIGLRIVQQWTPKDTQNIRPYLQTLEALRRPGASCVLQGNLEYGFVLFTLEASGDRSNEMRIASYVRSRAGADVPNIHYNLRELYGWSHDKFEIF